MSLKLTLANSKNLVCPWSKTKVKRDALLHYRKHVVGFSAVKSRNKFQTATNHFNELLACEGKVHDIPFYCKLIYFISASVCLFSLTILQQKNTHHHLMYSTAIAHGPRKKYPLTL